MEPYYQPKSYAPSYGSIISSLRGERNSNTGEFKIDKLTLAGKYCFAPLRGK